MPSEGLTEYQQRCWDTCEDLVSSKDKDTRIMGALLLSWMSMQEPLEVEQPEGE